jgi:UPF0755 protein
MLDSVSSPKRPQDASASDSFDAEAEKMSVFKGCCVIFFVVLLVVVVLLGGGVWWAMRALDQPYGSASEEVVTISIQQGDGVADVAGKLEDAGLVRHHVLFQYVMWKQGVAGLIQAGEYEFAPPLTIADIADTITRQPLSEYEESDVRFLEGWTLAQMAEHLTATTHISGEEFLAIVNNPHDHVDDYDFVRVLPLHTSLEGYLFPDTYRIDSQSTAQTLVRKMLTNFGTKMSYELRTEIARQNKTLHDIVIMASIIEREVRSKEDKAIVGGIFTNRLRIGQKLEADSTVNYVVGENRPQATFEDLAVDSPYNTYKYSGLPVGPISNPGFDSLHAAIYPSDTVYFFFLTRLDTGEVIYSRTFDEHVRNKQIHLR